MSQVKTLPITATRWLSLLLCAITVATITVFLSKVGFVQKTYSSLGAILNANPVLHYSSASLAGIGIKLLLDKFYISHPKRSIGFNWRYPPVTIAVLASLFLTVFYMLSTAPKFDEAALYAQSFMSLKYLALTFIGMLITVIYQTKLYTQKPIFTAVLVALSLIYIVFAVSLADITPAFNVFMYLAASYFILAAYLLFDEYRQSKQPSITTENEDVTIQINPELNSLEDFRKWFKDDSTIKSTEELEPDLQVYATRITERLKNGGDKGDKGDKGEKDLAQHIALCGPYGCGKSSIVESIVNDLAKNSEKESVWIHSDISTWGAASGSVAHVVLSNIIDDISQYIDMCAFRALPKHYTEALKSGGSAFQFASTLLAGPVDIEGSFQKLNNVLKTTNHKLLITLQDVDRGTGDENEKRLNDIAALLDRLKNRDLNHINFIIVMGNEKPEHAVVLGKVVDHIETIISQDFKKILCGWVKLCTKEIFDKHLVLTHSAENDIDEYTKNNPLPLRQDFYQPAIISNNLIDSIRMLKRVMRRISKCWTEEKLLGEVDFGSLLLITTLREDNPALFNAFVNSYVSLVYGKLLTVAKTEDGKQKTINETLSNLIADFTNSEATHVYNALFKELLNLKEDITDKSGNSLKSNKNSGEQHLGVKPGSIDYLKRVLLETVPESELRDQVVIDSIKSSSTQELAKHVCSDYRWQEAFDRFGRKLLLDDKNQDRVKQITFDVLEHIGKDPNGFLTEGVFEEYTKQTIDSGNLESVLIKLVNLESGEKLLEHQLDKLQRTLDFKINMGNKTEGYGNIKGETERMEAANYSNELFQSINISNLLNSNGHKLSKRSFFICLKFKAFAQLADDKLNFLNKLIKNLFKVVINNKNTRVVDYLINATTSGDIQIGHVKEEFVKLSPEEREDILQTLVELRDNQENNSDIDIAIKNLSFSEGCNRSV
ncbi:hypothetical protein I6F48_10470 [Pseudoalteromonas sp. SWYJ118]|uniref:P-loop NTPase fold protein n=1 Tax=Pseudoalteromonas sp. SWYJ118 TaxID=2792062 RepID=UPI0018CDAD15|nr:P-loop NTPase fold protein [Pseudoalteromonas sp. SWYJ118]MBH0075983.1 hypothetical protein [Pseudoalteromonas sp. SWYJ118]